MYPRFRRMVVVVAVVAAFALPGVARGDAVTDWNTNANSAIFATTPTAHAAVLSTAMVQAAVYDAVNAIAGGYRPYLRQQPRQTRSIHRMQLRRPPRSASQRLSSSGAASDSADEVRRVARRDTRRASQDRRDRGRRSGGRRDARGARERRPQPLVGVPVRLRHDSRRVAEVAAALRRRPDTVGGQRDAVPRPERRDAAHGRAERADERRICGGLQRGEVARLAGRARRGRPIRRWRRSSGSRSRAGSTAA